MCFNQLICLLVHGTLTALRIWQVNPLDVDLDEVKLDMNGQVVCPASCVESERALNGEAGGLGCGGL